MGLGNAPQGPFNSHELPLDIHCVPAIISLMKSVTKQLKDLHDLSKGTHSLESVLRRSFEEYSVTYNKAEDGLPKDKYYDPKDYE